MYTFIARNHLVKAMPWLETKKYVHLHFYKRFLDN